ncbi:HNH endonuclease [Tianweitania sediminis]|uniref:HNH endonuclease n=1 Tax=Tianweitania sediminis TaxID=1502156 RepID=A0A8J7QZD8_9HYPH|nr:HNH endonuclease [Tianweitania sediminis]MBP0439598.1 HNH endonuclease [Tianweitania sediminis]
MARLKSLAPRIGALPPRIGTAGLSEQERLRARDRSQAWRAWYGTARWQKLRESVWIRDGLVCQQTGILCIGKYPADNSPVADHIIAHRGDPELFWDPANIQTVSKGYHDRTKQSQERTRGGGSKV